MYLDPGIKLGINYNSQDETHMRTCFLCVLLHAVECIAVLLTCHQPFEIFYTCNETLPHIFHGKKLANGRKVRGSCQGRSQDCLGGRSVYSGFVNKAVNEGTIANTFPDKFSKMAANGWWLCLSRLRIAPNAGFYPRSHTRGGHAGLCPSHTR